MSHIGPGSGTQADVRRPNGEAGAVRELWRGLGLPGLIDVHTHFMPKRVMDKVWRYFDSAGPLVGREWPISYRLAETERVEVLRGFGVTRFTSLVYPPQTRHGGVAEPVGGRVRPHHTGLPGDRHLLSGTRCRRVRHPGDRR